MKGTEREGGGFQKLTRVDKGEGDFPKLMSTMVSFAKVKKGDKIVIFNTYFTHITCITHDQLLSPTCLFVMVDFNKVCFLSLMI